MEVSLYSAAAAMNATEQWQDMLAQNLATASMVGGRKHSISFSSVAAGASASDLSNSGANYIMPVATTSMSFQQGDLKPTNNPTDFALQGPGFFTVQLTTGQKAYTRDGEFQMNSQGQLVTKQGYLVMSDSGPIQKDPVNPSPLTVSTTGEISQGVDSKGKLQVTDFNNPQALTMGPGGYFYASDPSLIAKSAPNTTISQGSVESANTSPTVEMSGLITAMRMFETNQKVMSMQNDRMTKVISDLGTPAS
jgi:flagellar basal body rod protein FlgG